MPRWLPCKVLTSRSTGPAPTRTAGSASTSCCAATATPASSCAPATSPTSISCTFPIAVRRRAPSTSGWRCRRWTTPATSRSSSWRWSRACRAPTGSRCTARSPCRATGSPCASGTTAASRRATAPTAGPAPPARTCSGRRSSPTCASRGRPPRRAGGPVSSIPTNWWHPLPAGPGYWQQPVDMKRFDDGELLMLMNVQDDTSAAMTAHAQPFLTRSDDDGRTWSELQPLGLGELASSWSPARMHLTPRGRLIAMLPGTDHKLVYESSDRGRTWTEGGHHQPARRASQGAAGAESGADGIPQPGRRRDPVLSAARQGHARQPAVAPHLGFLALPGVLRAKQTTTASPGTRQ